MKRPCLPLPALQAPTTNILPTKCLNVAEPRIFCPPKITRYTVLVALCYVALASPPRHQHLRCFHYLSFKLIGLANLIATAIYTYHYHPIPPCTQSGNAVNKIPPLDKHFKKPPPLKNRRTPSKQHLKQMASGSGEDEEMDGEYGCGVWWVDKYNSIG